MECKAYDKNNLRYCLIGRISGRNCNSTEDKVKSISNFYHKQLTFQQVNIYLLKTCNKQEVLFKDLKNPFMLTYTKFKNHNLAVNYQDF